MKTILKLIILFTAVFLLAACQNNTASEAATPVAEKEYVVEGEMPSSPTAQGWIQDAAEDLAEMLEIPLSEIEFVEFELVVWPDGSYGCSSFEGEFTDLPKEGYRVQLRSNSRLYFYHGGEDTEQFLCLE